MKLLLTILISIIAVQAKAQTCASLFVSEITSHYKFYDPEQPDQINALIAEGFGEKLNRANLFKDHIEEFEDSVHYLTDRLSKLLSKFDSTQFEYHPDTIKELREQILSLETEATQHLGQKSVNYVWLWTYSLRVQKVFNLLNEYYLKNDQVSADYTVKPANSYYSDLREVNFSHFVKQITKLNDQARAIRGYSAFNDFMLGSIGYKPMYFSKKPAKFLLKHHQFPVFVELSVRQVLKPEGEDVLLAGVPLDRVVDAKNIYVDYLEFTKHDWDHNNSSFYDVKWTKAKNWKSFNEAFLSRVDQIENAETKERVLNYYFILTHEVGGRKTFWENHVNLHKKSWNRPFLAQTNSELLSKMERILKKRNQTNELISPADLGIMKDILDDIDRRPLVDQKKWWQYRSHFQ